MATDRQISVPLHPDGDFRSGCGKVSHQLQQSFPGLPSQTITLHKLLGVSKDVRVTSYHGMFEENLKKHLSNKMLAVYVSEHFESFRSIQFEFGKTGRIQIGYSGCTSSQASSNTSEHYSIRGVHRSVFGRIRARIFGFLRSVS